MITERALPRQVLMSLMVLIVILPLHNLVTFVAYLFWDNFFFVKAIASWKEILTLFAVAGCWKCLSLRGKRSIVLGVVLVNALLIANSTDSDTIIRFNRSYTLFYVLFLVGSCITLDGSHRKKILAAIRVSALVISVGGLLDYCFHFGDFLASKGYMNYSVTYLGNEWDFNSFTELPHTYYSGDIYRIGSFVLHPLTMNINLLFFLPFVVFSYLVTRRTGDLVVAMLILGCIILSFSRGPLIVAIAMFAMIHYVHNVKRNRVRPFLFVLVLLLAFAAFSTTLYQSYSDLFESMLSMTDPSTISRIASYYSAWDAFTLDVHNVLLGSREFNYFSESEILSALALVGLIGTGLLLYQPLWRLHFMVRMKYHPTLESAFMFAGLLSAAGYLLYAFINPLFTNMIISVPGAFLLGETNTMKQRIFNKEPLHNVAKGESAILSSAPTITPNTDSL